MRLPDFHGWWCIRIRAHEGLFSINLGNFKFHVMLRYVAIKVQRSCAELCENGAAKRHLSFPFSAHLLNF